MFRLKLHLSCSWCLVCPFESDTRTLGPRAYAASSKLGGLGEPLVPFYRKNAWLIVNKGSIPCLLEAENDKEDVALFSDWLEICRMTGVFRCHAKIAGNEVDDSLEPS